MTRQKILPLQEKRVLMDPGLLGLDKARTRGRMGRDVKAACNRRSSVRVTHNATMRSGLRSPRRQDKQRTHKMNNWQKILLTNIHSPSSSNHR